MICKQRKCTSRADLTVAEQTSLDPGIVPQALGGNPAGLLCGCDVTDGCT